MRFKTVQASSFKAAFEVLKDILNDVNMYFTPDGVKILTLDTARVALVDLELHADNFEEYECVEPITAGINITNTFKLLKTISNTDTLTVEINNKDVMNIFIENPVKKTNTKFELKLLDIDEDHIQVPEVPVTITTIMPSIDFQRICRDMNNLASELIISRNTDKLVISCEGDFANQETVITCPNEIDTTCTGKYSLKYLNIFTKATGMCSNVQIMHEEKNRFLILQYNVANLGDIKFYLATKADQDS
jgi:proliferating cell nuclear antigen